MNEEEYLKHGSSLLHKKGALVLWAGGQGRIDDVLGLTTDSALYVLQDGTTLTHSEIREVL